VASLDTPPRAPYIPRADDARRRRKPRNGAE